MVPRIGRLLGGGACCRATVAVVVFVALVVEIINQEHVVDVGDVITDHPNCSKIGAEILDLGGNAIDAAIAAGLCLTIAVPQSASIGGGGIMLIHQLRTNKTTVIDFQEISPKELPVQKYMDNHLIARFGKRSIAVPGLIAGLRYAHQKYGSHTIRRECCGWGDLIKKTIRLVDHGFNMTDNWDKKFPVYMKTKNLDKFIQGTRYDNNIMIISHSAGARKVAPAKAATKTAATLQATALCQARRAATGTS